MVKLAGSCEGAASKDAPCVAVVLCQGCYTMVLLIGAECGRDRLDWQHCCWDPFCKVCRLLSNSLNATGIDGWLAGDFDRPHT